MKLLINLISIKSGGGQQVTSNFVQYVLKNKPSFEVFFLVTENTHIHQKLIESGLTNILVAPKSLSGRFIFINWRLKKILKNNGINMIYTLFGPGIKFKGIISVTGCAYSNIFFPEIKFWNYKNPLIKIKKKLIDHYRKTSIFKSDIIVFENVAMQRRAIELFNFPERKTKLILPSISNYSLIKDEAIYHRLKVLPKNQFICLFLASWHPNKNLELVPDILLELKRKKCDNVCFVLTVSPEHTQSQELISRSKKLGVSEKIILFDSVKPDEVPLLLDKVNAIFLLSLLESFSNNIIEAWHFKLPLFISDEEWARALCADSAIYVSRNDPNRISDAIIEYINWPDDQKYRFINEAMNMLEVFPSAEEKVEQQFDLLKSIYDEKIN